MKKRLREFKIGKSRSDSLVAPFRVKLQLEMMRLLRKRSQTCQVCAKDDDAES